MANGGFEIPVEITPQIKDAGSTQKFFTDLANQGSAAINKVAREAGQPINQEVNFEVRDGKLQASIRNTSSLLKKMERAMEAARKREQAAIKATERQETAFRKKQIKQIEMIRKAEFKRIAEVQKAEAKAQAAALKRLQKMSDEIGKQIELERRKNAELAKNADNYAKALVPQKGSIAAAEQNLQLQKQRLNNMTYMSAEYVKQQGHVKSLEAGLKKMGKTGQQSGLAIVSGFLKAQAVMMVVLEALKALRMAIGDVVDRTKQIQALEVSFKAFGLSAEDAAKSLEFTKSVSSTYGAELGSLDKTMRRITPTIVTMGGNLNDSKLLTEALAKRTAMLGLNTEQTGRYLEAFAQVMGKGKLQSEELNQQFSELDGALRGQVAQYLEANYGITNLNKAMEDGEVKAHMFAEAFHNASEEMSGLNEVDLSNFGQQLKEGEVTLQQVQNAIGSIKTDNLENIGKSFSGLTTSLTEMWLAVNQIFANDTVQMALAGIAVTLEGMVDIITMIIKLVAVGAAKIVQDIEWIAKTAAESIPVVGQFFKLASQFAKDAPKSWDEITGAVDDLFNSVFKLPEATERASGGLSDLGRKAYEAVPAIEAWEPALKKASKELESLAKNSYKSKEAQHAFEDGLTSFKNKIEDQVAAYAKLKAEIKEKIKLEQISAAEGQERIQQIEEETKALKRKGEEYVTQAKRTAEAAKDGADKVSTSVTKSSEAVKTAAQVWQEWDKQIGESFGNAEAVAQRAKIVATNMQSLNRGVASLGSLFGDAAEQSKLMEGALDGQKDEVDSLIQSYAMAAAAGGTFSASQRRVIKELQATSKELEKVQNEMQKTADKAKAVSMSVSSSMTAITKSLRKELAAEQTGLPQEYFDLQEQAENFRKEIKRVTWTDAKGEIINKEMVAALEEGLALTERKMRKIAAETQAARNELDGFEDSAQNAANALQQFVRAGNAARIINGGSPAIAGARAEGGPVSGGSTYQVNELGREGFLSSSGRLSEIKVPAFGSWKAPSSGEVIPAHVWSELKAAGSAVTSSASRLASTGASGMVSHIRQSGDVDNSRVTNHVTIQSASPIQAASEVMVAAAKRRRRRFR